MTNDDLSGLDGLSDLTNEGELPHLSKTITYATDIEPYPFIGIHSGVGSGKNYFIDILARGYSDPDENGHVERFPEQTILLITPRRAKVNELLNDKSIKKDRWFGQWDSITSYAYDDLEDFEDALCHMRKIDRSADAWSQDPAQIYQRYLPCTSAAIESYMRTRHAKNDSRTHLWNRFDIIVFDEAHTIRSDTNYQTAPYYTMRLLQETYSAQQMGLTKCKIIIMTGTPQVLADFQTSQKYHLIDRMDVCRNVTPKKVIFIDRKQSRSLAEKMLSEGKRCIFFFNRTRELLAFFNRIKKKDPSLASTIAVSFSKEAHRTALEKKHKDDFARMEETEQYIALNQKLPDNIKMLLTTERNKEGINIKNADIRTMFVESHAECSIVQMAGRLREGIDNLYIVTDSIPHEDKESVYEWHTTKDGNLIDYYNQELQSVFQMYGFDPSDPYAHNPPQGVEINAYIAFVEHKYPYIIFDPLDLCFKLYTDRRRSKLYYSQQNQIFDEAKSDPQELYALANSWYPNAEVSVEYSNEFRVTLYLKQHKLIGKKITYSQQQALLEFIKNITGESRKTLGPALKPYGYRFIPDNKHKGSPGEIQAILE